MAKQKNIFDLIKANQHKLEEAPAPRTWKELERRLDGRQKAVRLRWLKYAGSIAAGLLLLFTLSMIVWLEQTSEKIMASADRFEQVYPIDNSQQAIQLIKASQNIYRTAPQLNERRGGNFIVKTSPPATNISPSKSYPEKTAPSSKDQIAELSQPFNERTTPPPPVRPDKKALAETTPQPSSPTPSENKPSAFTLDAFSDIEEDFSPGDITAEKIDPPKMDPKLRVTPPQNDLPNHPAIIAAEAEEGRKLEKQLQETITFNDLINEDDYSAIEHESTHINQLTEGLSADMPHPRKSRNAASKSLVETSGQEPELFNWLEGIWQIEGTETYLSWSFIRAKTLSGDEYVGAKKVDSVIETYQLEWIENELLLTLNPYDQKPTAFKLVSDSSGLWVFQHKEESSLFRIVLEKKKGKEMILTAYGKEGSAVSEKHFKKLDK